MRVLLDECVPRKLRSELRDHVVKTVGEMRWAGIKNGALLRRAALEFDVLLTVDQGIPFQQELSKLTLALVIIKSQSNDIKDLCPKMPAVLRVLATGKPGQVIQVEE